MILASGVDPNLASSSAQLTAQTLLAAARTPGGGARRAAPTTNPVEWSAEPGWASAFRSAVSFFFYA
jgi:hypothetical protein